MSDEEAARVIDEAFAEFLAKNPQDKSAREHYERTKAALTVELKGMVLRERWKASLRRLLRMVGL